MRPLIPEERARLARLVRDCGKMTILDKLLVKLHKEGHRVLVFSLFTSMLDILQEYCELKGTHLLSDRFTRICCFAHSK